MYTYAVILAAGTGKRMGGDIPKQFISIKGKPIIAYTVETFLNAREINRIVIVASGSFIHDTGNIIDYYFGKAHAQEQDKKIEVISGGVERIDSLINAIEFIKKEAAAEGRNSSDIMVVSHDAARMFVTEKMIIESINAAKESGASTVAVASTDTMLESSDGSVISSIPDRRIMYRVQTPQTFKLNVFSPLVENLTQEKKKTMTDAAGICNENGIKVKIVEGSEENIKITFPRDIKIAEMQLDNK